MHGDWRLVQSPIPIVLSIFDFEIFKYYNKLKSFKKYDN